MRIVIYIIALGLLGFSFLNRVNAQGTSYHASADAVYSDLRSIAGQNPSIAKIVELTPKSIQGRTILALKISKDVGSDKNKNRILFEGGTHAREWISPEVSILLARHLVTSYKTNATIKSYIDNEEIWIVPLVNPDGYQFTKGSGSNNRMWRKNRRDNGGSCSNISTGWGVDNNRNYGPSWGTVTGNPAGSAKCTDETYRGKSAYSEAESQTIRDLLQKYKFSSFVSYHSFSQLILYPYGYSKSPAPDNALLSAMAKRMSALIKAVHGVTYTPEPASELYIAAGDSSDHAYDVYKIPSFTIELRPTGNNLSGFLLPASQIVPTWEENKPAAMYLIDLLNLNIKSPVQSSPRSVKAGDTIQITVNGMWRGKQASDFIVKIGGTPAQVTRATRQAEVSGGSAQNAYVLQVTAPAKAAGKHNLDIAVGDAADREVQAISYSEGAAAPEPTGGVRPTVRPTAGPTARPTTRPTARPTGIPVPSAACLGACPTIPLSGEDSPTKFSVEILLHGIGNSGDNTNPNLHTFSNKNPKNQTRNGTVYLVNSNKKLAAESSGEINYDSSRGSFKGVIELESPIANGIYTIKLKASNHLSRISANIQSIKDGSTYVLPPVHLVAGDLNDDDRLDILDYAIFVDCFGGASTENCTDEKKALADINDDGAVNSIDYNLFIRELSVQG